MELRYNSHTEFRRLIFTLEQIKSGFYYENDFVILPYSTDYRKTVILPQYKLEKIPDLKNKIPNKEKYKTSEWEIPNNLFTTKDREILDTELRKHFLKDNQIKKVEKELKEKIIIAKKITDPLIQIETQNLIIIPTIIGTAASIFKNNNKTIIYWRINSGFSKPFAMIIANALSKETLYNSKDRTEWISRMKIIESIMINTNLRQIFPDFEPLLNNDYPQKELYKLKEISEKYLSRFNLNHKIEVKLKDNKIFLQKKELKEKDYYPQSIKLLKLFVQKVNKTLTFEEIAKLLWENECYEKFSLQAIAKQVQFIRQILTDYQIPSENLQSVSKRGYMLKVTE